MKSLKYKVMLHEVRFEAWGHAAHSPAERQVGAITHADLIVRVEDVLWRRTGWVRGDLWFMGIPDDDHPIVGQLKRETW